MAANTNNNHAERLAALKKKVEVCKEALADAKSAESIALGEKNGYEKNLRAMGVDPENAAQTISDYDRQIEERLALAEKSIPEEVLRELKRA